MGVQLESQYLERKQKFIWIGLKNLCLVNEQNDISPIFWKRMRDNIFLVWKKGDLETNRKLESDKLDRFLWKLNSFEKTNWVYSWKRERWGVTISWCVLKRRNDSFGTKVYREEMHSQKYVHWKPNHSCAVKFGVLKGLLSQGPPVMWFERGPNRCVESFTGVWMNPGVQN